ncbi:MAG: ImmA/IrrE family metallo-endopeptidase, partial [Deltaproteobacteria bacterium]|nr:ImmA/IrrE family metallo-endopeptidase [Deltaproteobacteria bacterium]
MSTIPANLRRLRQAKDLTQESLADRSGLSRAAYRKIEGGRSEPRVSTLQAIAAALDVRLTDLVAPARTLTAIRFRSLKRLRSREQILVDVGRWLADFNELESLVGDLAGGASRRAGLPELVGRPDPVEAAAKVREAFGLGPAEPIRDICGLLEAYGVKVGRMNLASHDFFGLSVAPADGGPAVVVNSWERISVERWIFTAAHEMGHLLLHLADYDVTQTAESEEHEKQANAFAAAFLMPDDAFRREWDETYGLPFVDRVLKVKRLFRVSYRTVLHRLGSSLLVPGNVWVRFQTDFLCRHGRTLLRDDEPSALERDAFRASFPETLVAHEPEHLSRVDFPGDRLWLLVRKAV